VRFAFTEEQEDLRAVVRRFVSETVDSAVLRRIIAAPNGFDAQLWSSLNELGVGGLAIAEEFDGSGAGLVELSVVLEELGKALVPTPFFSSVILASTLLQQSGDHEAMSRWLPALATGSTIATVAYLDSEHQPTRALQVDGVWRLTGMKRLVVSGASAGLILVTASTSSGSAVFAIDGAALGVTFRALPVFDLTRPQADLEFVDVAADLIGCESDGDRILTSTLDIARIALAAELVGVAQAALDMATDYAKTRVQFDRPIASFEAIKHKSADMYIDVETSRALVMHAAWTVDAATDDVPEVAAMTLAHVSDASFRVVAHLLQILGGIGYTSEHDAHLYFKRARASGALLGSADSLRERFLERTLDPHATAVLVDATES
jgi:alkylation response protein AidB-like acyl-CoA dehydrogenase